MTDNPRGPQILPGYIHNDGARWHITFDGDNLVVRIVDFKNLGTPRLFTHMPAGNVVILAPEIET